MTEDETREFSRELNSLAYRFGIKEYVFMHNSSVSYGHIHGSTDGPVSATRVLWLIDTIRLVVMTQMVRGMNKDDASKKKSRKKMDRKG